MKKKLVVSVVIIAMLVVTVVYNLPARASHTQDESRSEMYAKVLDDQDLAELEGGIRLKCIGVLILAAGVAATGPGLLLAAGMSLAVVCTCDEELDKAFGTNFVEACEEAI